MLVFQGSGPKQWHNTTFTTLFLTEVTDPAKNSGKGMWALPFSGKEECQFAAIFKWQHLIVVSAVNEAV